jgi:hypothetical protein
LPFGNQSRSVGVFFEGAPYAPTIASGEAMTSEEWACCVLPSPPTPPSPRCHGGEGGRGRRMLRKDGEDMQASSCIEDGWNERIVEKESTMMHKKTYSPCEWQPSVSLSTQRFRERPRGEGGTRSVGG